jgi:hypothetical protein
MQRAGVVRVAACTFALMVVWIGVGTAGCGQATEVSQLGGATTTEGAATTTSAIAATAPAINVSGDAVLQRPHGKVLFAAKWGGAEGEFGYDVWGQGVPSQNPIEIAVSQDNNTIAILDYANRRVQVYSYDGSLLKVSSPKPKLALPTSPLAKTDGSMF